MQKAASLASGDFILATQVPMGYHFSIIIIFSKILTVQGCDEN